MKKVLFSGILLLTLLACNKDQKAIKKMDGNWNATKYKITDSDPDFTFSIDFASGEGVSYSASYDECKLKDDEWCTYTETQTILGDPDTFSGFYRVTKDGTVLELKDTEASTDIEAWDIVELSKDEIKLNYVNGTETGILEMTKE